MSRNTFFILVAASGLLSTSAAAAFVPTNDKNPDNHALITKAVVLILVWCVPIETDMDVDSSQCDRDGGQFPHPETVWTSTVCSRTFPIPHMVVIATSAASRPTAIGISAGRTASVVASTLCHAPLR